MNDDYTFFHSCPISSAQHPNPTLSHRKSLNHSTRHLFSGFSSFSLARFRSFPVGWSLNRVDTLSPLWPPPHHHTGSSHSQRQQRPFWKWSHVFNKLQTNSFIITIIFHLPFSDLSSWFFSQALAHAAVAAVCTCAKMRNAVKCDSCSLLCV